MVLNNLEVVMNYLLEKVELRLTSALVRVEVELSLSLAICILMIHLTIHASNNIAKILDTIKTPSISSAQGYLGQYFQRFPRMC